LLARPGAVGKTPDGPYKLAQLVRANQALYDVCTAYVSADLRQGQHEKRFRARRPQDFDPADGAVLDHRQAGRRTPAVTMPFKQSGDAIYVIGLTRNELGASEFHRWLAAGRAHARLRRQAPGLDTALALALYRAMARPPSGPAAFLAHAHLGGLAVLSRSPRSAATSARTSARRRTRRR